MYLHKDPGSFTDISRQLGERYNSIGNLDFITQKKKKLNHTSSSDMKEWHGTVGSNIRENP